MRAGWVTSGPSFSQFISSLRQHLIPPKSPTASISNLSWLRATQRRSIGATAVIPRDKENDPVVLVNFHDAAAYCRLVGRRLPTVDEWKSTCEGGKLKKRGDIWEWTSTDVDMGGQTYKALCGPANTCDCSHRYLPEWKNEVKGFRCVQDQTPVTWLPVLFQGEAAL